MVKKINKSKQSRQAVNRVLVRVPRLVGPTGAIPLGFPDKLMTRVRYHDTNGMTSTTGSIAKYAYRLNSTFDPDSTGVGHQPMFRDTFASIYDHYSVVSTHVTIKFVNNSSVTYHVGALIDDDGSTSSSIDVLCEDTNGQRVVLPAVTGSLSSHTFVVNWDAKKYLGIDPFASQTYKTAVGSNPSEESYLTLWAVPTDGSSTATMLSDVMIEYSVLWTELTSPSSS